ncbi:haloacid dehalogenase-like hydrolase [Crateriforma conspicua]|nr:HAD family hydrolase [Crateriforma conspicua]QDV64964.1 haloacid dehalogenase-like hydrolase [Crateriforma conspicua]
MKLTPLHIAFALVMAIRSIGPHAVSADDPLPSWNDADTKTSITSFVQRVTDPDSTDFVEPALRIATFDNDGTLWSEKPFYFQLAFALDRVKAMAPMHPEWKQTQPFQAVLEGDMKTVMAGGKESLLKIVATTHAGMTAAEFEALAYDWIQTAKHPKTGRLYKDMVYQPMLELLTYLQSNGFKTFIVSGGGIDFMRPWTMETYGIPPEQVVGSSIKTKYELRDGKPVILRMPDIDFIDDKEGKPIGIHSHIGRRPIFAAGNSDGDWQMLQYATMDHSPSFGLIVHHTDADREWAYDRQSAVGKLDKVLDDAPKQGWTVVDMKRDWKQIYPK